MSASDFAALALALLLASPARAETPMTADEFDAFSVGKTLDYAVDGVIYGSEMHLPGRKTRDADTGRECHDGTWVAQDDQICFIYAPDPTLHCWRFWRRGDGLLAVPTGAAPDAPPSEVTVAKTPLACAGPDVGA